VLRGLVSALVRCKAMVLRRMYKVGGLVDETDVCLGVYGEDLNPAEVTEILRCEPSRSHRRGDPMKRGHLRHKGAWLLSVRGALDPEALTAGLLDRFVDVDESTWAGLADRHDLQLRLGLFLNRWNRGLELSPGLVGRIARIHARMIFDIYGQDGDVDIDDVDVHEPQEPLTPAWQIRCLYRPVSRPRVAGNSRPRWQGHRRGG
jgi:hypothetical protein